MELYNMIRECGDIASRTVHETMEPCNARDLGLDSGRRCALFVNKHCIAVQGSTASLEYYSGFEYVDRDYVHKVGDWTFYFGDDDRVREHIEIYYEREEEAASV